MISSYLSNYMQRFMAETGLDAEDAEALYLEFDQISREIWATMVLALEENRFEDLAKHAHQLKGASGNLRLDPIYERASLLEELASVQDRDRCKTLVMELLQIEGQ